METFQVDWDALVAALQPLVEAFNALAQAIAAELYPILTSLTNTMQALGRAWGYWERCWRAYARWYNARHPHRKVSWRKLNRLQRMEALRYATL